MKFLIIAALMNSADASFGQFCQRIFLKMAAPDPYQFEESQTEALVLYYESIGIRGAWGRLNEADGQTLNVLGGELRWRLQTGLSLLEADRAKVEAALETYQAFEVEAPYAKGRNR